MVDTPTADNFTVSAKPWRLTAAPPGTLDVLIDVEDPVTWTIGSDQNPGRITEPICGRFPVLTTRGNVRGLKGKFTFFIPDTADRDKIMDSIIDSAQDTNIPYYVWKATDGEQSWNIQFDPSDKITLGYLSGHRVLMVPLLQVGENLSDVPDGYFAGIPAPITPGKPTVGTKVSFTYSGEKIPVTFTNAPKDDPNAFIGLFLPSDDSNSTFTAVSYAHLGGAGEGQFFLDSISTIEPNTYELRLITTNPPGIVRGPKITVSTATLTASVAVSTILEITFNWSGFDNADAPAYIQYLQPGDLPVLSLPISGSSGSIVGTIYNVFQLSDPVPQIVLMSGRKIMGPLG